MSEVPTSREPVVVAAFDFDGTLTDGGSVWSFLAETSGPGPTVRAALSITPQLVAAAVFGGRWADDAKEALFRRTLAGIEAEALAERAARFGRAHFAEHRRPDVVGRLEQHRRLGHRIVIVSASPEVYVRTAGADIGADAVVATRLEVSPDGRLTGGYDGRNCRGQQKIDRLRAWMDQNAPGALLWAYGNSAGDLRLLDEADVGVDVGRLGRFGRLRAFRRLRDTAELVD